MANTGPCFWYNRKSHADASQKFSFDDAFNSKPKKRGFLFSSPSPLRGLRHRGLDRESESSSTPGFEFSSTPRSEYSSTPRIVFGGRGHDHSRQTPELPVACLSFASRFKWTDIFKPWKKGSTKQQAAPSSPPSDEPNDETTNEDIIIGSIHHDVRDGYFNPPLTSFSSSQLRNATNDFSKDNLIGRGGYADVFKGRLNGQLVAIKRLNKGTKAQRNSSFLRELDVIAYLDHPNTAKLLGCSSDEELCLVFQLSPLGSLASLLHGPDKDQLDWDRRYRIALGIANGLLYLHDHCHRRIIHRDIKADNILLAENFEPQICDFGLAKWLPPDTNHQLVTKFEGTFGYFAPEYLSHGIIDEKTDVFSFGILLLELLTGRKALDYLQQSILLWAKPWLDAHNIKELMDPSLGDNYNRAQVERVVLTASLCVEQSPLLRPRMVQAVVLLRGDDVVMEFGNGSPRRILPRTQPEPEEPQLP